MFFTYRYTELIKVLGGAEHMNCPLESSVVKEKDLEKACVKMSLCSGLFRGKGPWVVCRSEGYPLIVLELSEVTSVCGDPPNNSNYLRLNYSETKGWLIYCRRHECLASTEKIVYDFKLPEVYKEYTTDTGGIYESELMEYVNTLPEEERPKNPYVDWRIRCWKANFIMPQQYLTFGWGNCIHLARIMRIHNLNAHQAWDFLWLGKIETRKKKAIF